MKRHRRPFINAVIAQEILGLRLWLLAILLSLRTCYASTNFPVTADNQVQTLYDAEWAWRAKELGNPDDDLTSRAGYLPHVDPVSQQKRFDYWSKKLSALNAIPASRISAERVNAAVFRTVLEAFVAQQKFRDYEAPFTSGGSFWGSLAPRGGLDNVAAYRA
jgi:hypothetical protein